MLFRAFVLAAAIAGVCLAQPGRIDVRGDIGWTGFLDDASENHLLIAGSVPIYLTNRLSFQQEVQYLRRTSGGNHSDLVFLPSLVFDFRGRGSRVVPYVTGGPGFIYTTQGNFSSTNWFASGGFGAKVFLTDRLYVAPEFRVGWEPHARFSVGVGYIVRR